MAPRSGFERLLPFCLVLFYCSSARAMTADTFIYDTPDGRQTVDGQLVTRSDAELLFIGRDGRMHLVNVNRVVELKEAPKKPRPFTKEEMIVELRREFGGGFRVFTTNRYVICYNCDSEFAKSCGTLFERLHRAFTNYFSKAGFEIKPSDYPLVAVVFGEERDFLAYATRELGEDMARNVIGYYSFLTNRIVLYDLQAHAARKGLGNVGFKPQPGRRGIEGLAAANIATVVHEATHQLAYNSGFHQRFSDNPLWLAEGMAMFVEAPRQAPNWDRIGEVNKPRLDLFRKRHFANDPVRVDIQSLIQSDELLRNKDTALDAYADCWALTFYLIRTHREQFFQYLKNLGKKLPLDQDQPDQRLADFRAAFGDDIGQLEEDFLRYMRALPR
jgi:Protein of unknown function (DUF1570)